VSTTAKIVTARKSYNCDAAQDASWFRHCSGRIAAGQQYVRMVCFPGDVNSSHVPWVMRACPACATSYTGPAGDIARDMLAEQVGEVPA
jgi:hypothetical protein